MRALIAALVVLTFSTSPSWASCLVTQSTPDFLEMREGGGTLFRTFRDELRPGNDRLQAADLQVRLTNIFQFRQTRADLPIDDPDRFIDPGGPFATTGTDGLGLGEKLYWCDADGNPMPGDTEATHMCASGDCIIDSVDVANDGSFILTIRKGRDCSIRPDFPSCNP